MGGYSMSRWSFGVERPEGVVDGLSIGDVDPALGKGGDDLFGWTQAVLSSNAARNWGT